MIFIIQLGVTVTVAQSKEDFIDTYAGAQFIARLLLYALCSTDAVTRGLIRNAALRLSMTLATMFSIAYEYIPDGGFGGRLSLSNSNSSPSNYQATIPTADI